MKRLLLIVLPLLLIVGCSKPINESSLVDRSGVKYQQDSQKPYTGKVFRLYNTGEKLYQGTYKDGLLITYSYFKKDGSMKEPINYETELIENNGIYLTPINNERFSGQVFSLHDNGDLKCRGALFNGESFGSWTYFDKGGDSIETTVPPIKYFDLIRKSEINAEQGIITQIVDGLETWGMEEFMDTGIKSWPDNPFETLATISFDYDEDQTDMRQMNRGDWIFTGESGLTYEDISLANAIVHRRVEDTLSVWIYNPVNGSISHDDTPYLPYTKIYKDDLAQ